MSSFRRFSTLAVVGPTLIIVAFAFAAGISMTQAAETEPAKESGKTLRHVVLFKFKESVTEEQIQEVVTAFAGMKEKIDAIKDFEWGTDVGVENKSEGFTHGFVVTFDSTEGRDEYLPHPAHKDFGKVVAGKLDKVLVFDFWAKETP
ncbi:MAG TPA: Dabb family protein [Pirellulaceae bacterium]|jgi:hypothetical protein|nr:Dabb family protein [Pirellulaceae bacterium]